MRLNALLLCREQQPLRTLAVALDELGIESEVCLSSQDVLELLAHGHYSALVLDFDVPGAIQVARLARLAPPQRRPVVFAMIGVRTGIANALQAGANFVLYKPLIFEQVMRSLRAGHGFMRPDRRRSPRQKVETLVYLQFGVAALPAIVLDVNEQGLALQAPEPLPAVDRVPLRFVLPGTEYMVEATGEMIWADDEGRVGMLFANLPSGAKKHLKEWLHRKAPKKKSARSVAPPEKSRAPLRLSH